MSSLPFISKNENSGDRVARFRRQFRQMLEEFDDLDTQCKRTACLSEFSKPRWNANETRRRFREISQKEIIAERNWAAMDAGLVVLSESSLRWYLHDIHLANRQRDLANLIIDGWLDGYMTFDSFDVMKRVGRAGQRLSDQFKANEPHRIFIAPRCGMIWQIIDPWNSPEKFPQLVRS